MTEAAATTGSLKMAVWEVRCKGLKAKKIEAYKVDVFPTGDGTAVLIFYDAQENGFLVLAGVTEAKRLP